MAKKAPRRSTKKDFIDKRIYSDFVFRFFAYLIDMVIIYAVDWTLFYLFYFIFNFSSFELFYVILHMIAYLIGFFYFNLLETYNKGQTAGKLIFQIKSVNEETKQAATFRDNIINNVLKCNFISCVFDVIIGVIKNYDDKKKRIRILQNYSNVVVISSKKNP